MIRIASTPLTESCKTIVWSSALADTVPSSSVWSPSCPPLALVAGFMVMYSSSASKTPVSLPVSSAAIL